MYAVLDLPGGAFLGTGVKTVVLFFENKPTDWYYQLNVGRNMGKTNPLNKRDMAEFVQMAKTKELSDNSWLVDVADINRDVGFNCE